MNREDIIRMAQEASNNSEFTFVPEQNDDLVCLYLDELERFASLVASAEREACAKLCEEGEFMTFGCVAAAELRRMHDLLGKANALCRIRAEEIERLKAQPEQEPVTWRYKIVDVFGRPAWTLKTPKSDTRVLESQPLYTTPPQRTWVGLTDEDWNRSKHNYDFQQGVDWAEARLKEKNTCK